MKLGIIGLNNFDNGHPFSFSAIINGYDEKKFKKTNYRNILGYLKKKSKSDFGFKNVKITHAWTQDIKLTKSLCQSCFIENVVEDYKEMIGLVDGLIIARDDLHYEISKIFLEKNIPVFIDKPLTSNLNELNYFKKYLNKGLLMSTSGLRYAQEVFELKKKLKSLGKIKVVNAIVLNEFYKYGIHMLDIIDELQILKVKKIIKIKNDIDMITYFCEKNVTVNVQCLGNVNKIFFLQLIGTKKSINIEINDNFLAFKNTLGRFIKMIRNKNSKINKPESTLNVISVLIKTMKLKNGKLFNYKK